MKESDRFIEWLNCVPNIPKQDKTCWGKEYKGTCTCGGTIIAKRNTYNGHISARCDKCKITMVE